jgi:hypothetical protein
MGFFDALISIGVSLLLSVYFGALSLLSPLLPEPTISVVQTKSTTSRMVATTTPPKTSVATSTAPKVTTKPPVKKVPPPTVPTLVVDPPSPTTTPPPAPFSGDVNAIARQAIVNIFCTTKNGDVLHPITASGVFIDSRGIILTNAHVGQYLLLKDYLVPNFINCIARTGNPAYWVRDNASQITSSAAVGTGENDFALLYVTGMTDPHAPLPSTFPSVSLDTSERPFIVGSTMLVAAYPAGFLGGETILRDLYSSSAYTTVKEVYTFASTTIDVISIGGSVVAQKGSSGGGVFSQTATLVGLISTSSDGPTIDVRDLHAITLAHIDRSLRFHSGTSLSGILSGNILDQANSFAISSAPTLTKLLTDKLPQ